MLNPVFASAIRAIAFLVLLVIAGSMNLGTTASSKTVLPMLRETADPKQTDQPAGSVFNALSRHRAFQQLGQAEKTVEQTHKNIQVLKGLPDSQLVPVMNFISASLGVRCNFCHVNKEGNWDFVADEKPEKATARQMIKMVLDINKNYFRGATEVSCYTCHRGRTHPAGSIPLPLPTPPPPPTTPSQKEGSDAKPKETAPTVDQILNQYVEALGGKAAIEKLQSRAMKGNWLTSNGISLGYEVYQKGPDNLFTILNTPQQGTIERGFNGQVAWEKSNRGLRELEGLELFYLKRYPDLYKDIKLKEQFTKLDFAGTDKIVDRDVYVLRGTTTDNRRERLYFDTQSGLLLRRTTSMPTMIGVIPEQVDFEDYRQVDGMKLPFTIRISSIDPFFSSTRTFTEIKLNVPVDETKFNKPAAPPPPSASPAP
jgi:photosynthetic reaction center cytochrome c subunit